MKIFITLIIISVSLIFASPSIVHNTGIADFVQYNQYRFVDISGLADDALNRKDFKTAESLYYRAYDLAISKKNHKLIGFALLGIGTNFRIKEEFDSALIKLNQCLNYKDNIADSLPISLIYYNLGLSYHYLNNLDTALMNYTSALNYYPNAYWVLINRGDVYQDLKEYSSAISDYQQALQLDSTNADVMIKIAEICIVKKDLISTQYWFEQALKNKERLTLSKESEIQEKLKALPNPDKN